MLRALIRPALRSVSILSKNQPIISQPSEIIRKFSQLTIQPAKLEIKALSSPSLLSHPLMPQIAFNQKRNVTKFSLNKGKRKTVNDVIRRFKRLDWGIWIRTRAGKNKRIWKKSKGQRYRSRQHVFCNATQSNMLDKMVSKCWRKPKYYIDDPYAPYHKRENFLKTRKKPIEW